MFVMSLGTIISSVTRSCYTKHTALPNDGAFKHIPTYTTSTTHGGGTGKNVEDHVRENIGWILFKTCNFYIFLDIQ